MSAILLALMLAQSPSGVEPIRCWRQSTVGAVTIGETFTVTLTCAVFETPDTQVVPDESRLNVASIQMAPFEILGGSHPPDVRRGSRRFFQYDYQLRIISRDAIGQDVNVPPLTISYRIHSRVGAAAKLEGRDLSYLLPSMPVRVLSLVPADASDIRDNAEASFAGVEALRTRSRTFRAVAYGLGALAVVMAIVALVPLARRPRSTAGADAHLVPDHAVLDGAMRGLGKVLSKVEADGWTDEHLSDGLAGMRLISAAVIGHPISQKPLDRQSGAPEGRWWVEHGLIRRVVAAASSSLTTQDIARARTGAQFSTTRQQQLEGLQEGLALFTNALYRREGPRDAPALDAAVMHAITVAKDVGGQRRSWNPWRR